MRSSKSNILAVAVGAAIVASSSVAANGRSAEVLAAIEAGRAQYVTGELIVQYAASASTAERMPSCAVSVPTASNRCVIASTC